MCVSRTFSSLPVMDPRELLAIGSPREVPEMHKSRINRRMMERGSQRCGNDRMASKRELL